MCIIHKHAYSTKSFNKVISYMFTEEKLATYQMFVVYTLSINHIAYITEKKH